MTYKWYEIDRFIEILYERWEERKTTLVLMSTTIMNLDHIAAEYMTIEEMFDEDELIFLKQVIDAYCLQDSSLADEDKSSADIIVTYWELFDTVRYRIEEEGYVMFGETSMYAIYAVRRFLDDPTSVIDDNSARAYFFQFLQAMLNLIREEREALEEL